MCWKVFTLVSLASGRLRSPSFAPLLCLTTAIVGLLGLSTTSVSAQLVIPCAIRWDAWYDPSSSSLIAQQRLAPMLWRNRAPKHCITTSADALRCVGTQEVIDQEIRSAVEVGDIKCWAFDKYSEQSSLTTAWRLFQSSAIKDRIQWTWIMGLSLFGTEATRPKAIAELVDEMRQNNYQKVNVEQPNRPVLFLFWSEQEFEGIFHGNYDELKTFLSDLGLKAASEGLGKPYIVILRGIPKKAADIARSVGADAIGTYNIPLAPSSSGSFESLSRQTRSFWSQLVATQMPIVPTIMTGFDQQPNYASSRSDRPNVAGGSKVIYSVATDDQLSAEARSAANFINSTLAVPSKLLLIYSWNENSEGGGSLNETLGDPDGGRLRAFKRGIAHDHAN
jgi:hypothetical protein